MIAKARLVGVEHAPGCTMQAKQLPLVRSSTFRDKTGVDITHSHYSCAGCALTVRVEAESS